VHCDVDPEAVVGAPVTLSLCGDSGAVAAALVAELAERSVTGSGYRSAEVRHRLRDDGRTIEGNVPRPGFVEPRALLRQLDTWLPTRRNVVPEPAHACGDVLEYLRVTEPRSLVAPLDYQAIGLGLAAAVGMAVAHPDRITVAAVGDGGAAMALGELDTIARSGLPILVLVLNDSAYGAEVRELELRGQPVDDALFPRVDFAAVARAVGTRAATVRTLADLDQVREWIDRPDGPFVLDCWLDPLVPAAWFGAALGPDGYLRLPRPGYRPTAARAVALPAGTS
jgi:thiamine pyrophosphate-dependent acetolactate synthase large subunit-like protein